MIEWFIQFAGFADFYIESAFFYILSISVIYPFYMDGLMTVYARHRYGRIEKSENRNKNCPKDILTVM